MDLANQHLIKKKIQKNVSGWKKKILLKSYHTALLIVSKGVRIFSDNFVNLQDIENMYICTPWTVWLCP